jgi:hypothetical protein
MAFAAVSESFMEIRFALKQPEEFISRAFKYNIDILIIYNTFVPFFNYLHIITLQINASYLAGKKRFFY